MVAQLLRQAGTELATNAPAAPGQPAAQPRVVDVVPTTADDPRGAVLGSALLPLVLGGIITGFALAFASRPGFGQALGLVCVAALAGLVVVGIAQGWLGAFGGD